jgi:hypothetical protein
MEKKWREQNEKIMRENPAGGPPGTEQTGAYPASPVPEPDDGAPAPASAEARAVAVDTPEAHGETPGGGAAKPE